MAFENVNFSINLTAHEDMSDKQYHAVMVTGDFGCQIDYGSNKAIGIVTNNPREGMAAAVAVSGITKIKVAAGGTVVAGSRIILNDKGEAIGFADDSDCTGLAVALETVTGPAYATVLLGVAPTVPRE